MVNFTLTNLYHHGRYHKHSSLPTEYDIVCRSAASHVSDGACIIEVLGFYISVLSLPRKQSLNL